MGKEVQGLVQHQENSNSNSNNSRISLSAVSTVVVTGPAATGAIVTVPGILKTRKQSNVCDYLLKIHHGYDEFRKQPGNMEKYTEYTDLLEILRNDIIYLLQRRDINENQYKCLMIGSLNISVRSTI